MQSTSKNNGDKDLGKFLSWLLRHGALRENISISPEGFIPVDVILNHPKIKGRYSLSDIKRVVSNNDKQRFFLEDIQGTLQIRANQGHTLPIVQVQLKPILSAEGFDQVLHGTYWKNWNSIKLKGLSRVNRNHIHFALGLPDNNKVVSGARQNSEIFIYLNLDKALKAGLKFFLSFNNVVLSPGDSDGYIKPAYFEKVQTKDGRSIMFDKSE